MNILNSTLAWLFVISGAAGAFSVASIFMSWLAVEFLSLLVGLPI